MNAQEATKILGIEIRGSGNFTTERRQLVWTRFDGEYTFSTDSNEVQAIVKKAGPYWDVIAFSNRQKAIYIVYGNLEQARRSVEYLV